MENYRFHLEKYHRGSKTACPECKRKACFTRYVDESGDITFPSHVGKCDHENSCGYHYTPKDFFREHPDESESFRQEWKEASQSSVFYGFGSHAAFPVTL